MKVNCKLLSSALAIASVMTAQSAKNAVETRSLLNISKTTPGASPWTRVMATQIQTSQQKDLVLGVSLQTSLLTETLVSGSKGVEDTAIAEAGIEVEVCVNNTGSANNGEDCAGMPGYKRAQPGKVDFDKRRQELSAKFAGILSACTGDRDGDLIPNEVPDDCLITNEELRLLLNTTAAHSFNFALDDLGQGLHDVVVRARILITEELTGSKNGTAKANALIGKGSLVVEEVRLVKGQTLVL